MYFLGLSELLAVKPLVLNLTFFIQGFDLCLLSEATLYSYMYLSFGGKFSVCCPEIRGCPYLGG